MGVIYIGDRGTGKTHLAMELANPKSDYVKVSSPDYESLKQLLYDEISGGTRATEASSAIYARYIDAQVKLPTGYKQVTVDWIDTPGEIWRKTWQDDNPIEWDRFLETARQSEGIVLILPPHREILKPGIDTEEFITREQWTNRFKRWADFFCQDCPRARHILICLNKADLFHNFNLESEAFKLAYKPYGAPMNFQQRHDYVFKRYFKPLQPEIDRVNRSISGLSVRCFITTIYNRSLLELPWIYLGTYLGK